MDPIFIGQIALLPYGFVPDQWLECLGQLVYIRDYRPLFNVIGTAYGGDGKLTMGVPDLQGRTVVGQGTLSGGGTYTLTQKGGAETVTVTSDMVPQHTHWLAASSRDGTTNNPAGGLLANVVGGGPLDQSTG